MIPIALSYRIIKNKNAYAQQERKLETLDIELYREKKEIQSQYDAVSEGEDPEEALREEIRKELLLSMEEERKVLLEKAKEELEKEREKALAQARNQGFEEGYMAGKEEGYEETLAFRKNAITMMEEAEVLSKEYLDKNEEKIIQLSARIAERIVGETLQTQEDSLMLLARPILQEYGKTENVIVTCHPDKVAFMKCQIPEIKAMCPKAHVLILQDKNLEENDILIENENQITDLSIRKQIARFIELATE